jgi:predicted secreted Zn-dependent protease
VSIRFPRLKENAATPPTLKRAFSDFTSKLLLHERGHVSNAIDTAKRIKAGIGALQPQSHCTEVDRAANELGYSQLKEAQEWDTDYDARTRHGETQGASLP